MLLGQDHATQSERRIQSVLHRYRMHGARPTLAKLDCAVRHRRTAKCHANRRTNEIGLGELFARRHPVTIIPKEIESARRRFSFDGPCTFAELVPCPPE